MTPALMDLVVEQQKTALSESFRLLQGVFNVPRILRRTGHNRGFATAHRVVYTEGSMRLLQFHRESPPVWAEPLLICSAPVSRPYFLDLAATRSVVRQMLAGGLDTYLIDWGIATATDRGTRLSDLANPMMKNVVQFIRKRARMPHFHLMGYCLGGTLATIFTALYPSVVKDLVLMSAPIDLGGENSLLKTWANQDCFDVDPFIDAFGNCPAPSCGRSSPSSIPSAISTANSVAWRAECTMRSSSRASWRSSIGQTLRSRSPAGYSGTSWKCSTSAIC